MSKLWRGGVLLTVCAAAGGVDAAEPRMAFELAPAVTVVGTGEAQAVPDQAQITVGVTSEARSAAEALTANNERMRNLMGSLEEQGIARRDIQTSNFSVHPQYRHDERGQNPQIVGYQVSNQVRIRARDLVRLGTLLDQLVSRGANQIHGISFDIDDKDELTAEAQRRAMRDARERAERYAEAAGLTVGSALVIQEESFDHSPPVPMFRMEMAAADSVPIAQGEQTVSARIRVTYALEGGKDVVKQRKGKRLKQGRRPNPEQAPNKTPGAEPAPLPEAEKKPEEKAGDE